jgi:hypothetical protein
LCARGNALFGGSSLVGERLTSFVGRGGRIDVANEFATFSVPFLRNKFTE